MIELNKLNGELNVADLSIGATASNKQLEDIFKMYDVKRDVTNAEYRSYRVLNIDGGEISLFISFYKEKIFFVSIGLGGKYKFSPFVITDERETLNNKLKMLGGERKYSWGAVEYSEDVKGGIASIIVKYS